MTTHLPPPDPDTPDERLPGEAELIALYRQLPSSEPSPALDAAVLRAAAQALGADEAQPAAPPERRKGPRESGDWVHPKPGATASRRRQPRWLIGLSSAATLVLAAGLAWHLHEWPQPDSRTVPAPTTAADAAPVQVEAEVAATPGIPAMPPEPPKQPPPRIMAAKARALAPAPPAAPVNQPSMAKKAAPAPLRERRATAPAHAPAAVAQSAASGAFARAPAPTAMSASSPQTQDVMAAPPAPVAELAISNTAPNTSDTPAQELEKIRQLFAQGHDEEARQRLTAFHQAHPQSELPTDLRDKLRKP